MSKGYQIEDLGRLQFVAEKCIPELRSEVFAIHKSLETAKDRAPAGFGDDLFFIAREEFTSTIKHFQWLLEETNRSLEDTSEGLNAVVRHYARAEDIAMRTINRKADALFETHRQGEQE